MSTGATFQKHGLGTVDCTQGNSIETEGEPKPIVHNVPLQTGWFCLEVT